MLTANGQIALVLTLEDADQDLIKDAWEPNYHLNIASARPLDGSLYEIDGTGLYSGNFVTSDPNKRNLVRQDATGPRHSLIIFKFDLGASTPNPVTAAVFNLTVNRSTGGGAVETVGGGEPSLCTFIHEALAMDNRPALTITMGGDPTPNLDGDAVADAWEAAYFGTLSRDGSGDADADGTSDLTEFYLGLNPKDSTQAFRASVIPAAIGFTFSWPSQPGLQFEIRRSASLAEGDWQEIGMVTAVAGSVTSFTASEVPPGRAFYQVVLRP